MRKDYLKKNERIVLCLHYSRKNTEIVGGKSQMHQNRHDVRNQAL